MESLKLVVTSCADPLCQPRQSGWAQIARACPQHLVLLGDQMYMDYGWSPLNLLMRNLANGAPAALPDLDFAAQMYRRYQAQWRAMQGSGLWDLPGLKVHGVWDDHDFAWNNSRGAGQDDVEAKPNERPVPPRKQRIARFLFRQFFNNLRAVAYPEHALDTQPRIDALDEDLGVPLYHSDLPPMQPGLNVVKLTEGVHLVLTDGRSYRTGKKELAATVLGEAQKTSLQQTLGLGGITVVASGCTLNDHAPESWRHYTDYAWLKNTVAGQNQHGQARVLFLAGDVHRTDLRANHGPGLIEVVASGIARPWGALPWRRTKGNYAQCTFGAEDVQIELHEGESTTGETLRRHARIERAGWSLQA